MKSLSSRLRKLEPNAQPPASTPHVLEVEHGETVEEAFARFRTRWPNVRADHRFMVVPAAMTPAEFRIHAEARRAGQRRMLGTPNTAKDASL